MVSSEKFSAEKHYEEISSWWISQRWPVIPITHLSLTGIVILCDGMMAAAGWVYKTDSAFSLFEWIIVNPLIRHEHRTQCISKLIEDAKRISKEMGYLTIFTTARNENLISRMSKHGFAVQDSNMKNLTCNLCEVI